MNATRNMVLKLFPICYCLAIIAALSGCAHRHLPIEMTERDFTSLSEWRSTNLSFFGIRVGEGAAEARQRISGLPFRAESTPGVFNLFDQTDEVASIVFGAEQVSQIRLFPRASVYLAGASQRLFAPEIADEDSALRRQLLGREDKAISERGDFTTTVHYVYGPEGLELQRSIMRVGNFRPVVMITVIFSKPEKTRALVRGSRRSLSAIADSLLLPFQSAPGNRRRFSVWRSCSAFPLETSALTSVVSLHGRI